MCKSTILKVSNLYAGYNDQDVLEDINFEINHNEVVAVMGRSGCGKTTLIKVLAGLIAKRDGDIELNLQDGTSFSVMFQSPLLQPWLSAEDNISLPCRIAQRECNTAMLVNAVGLEGDEKKYPRELSGGMQRRVALARALSTNPSILFLDEPFGGVDEFTRERLYKLLSSVIETNKIGCMLVTHNLYEAIYLADRIVVLTENPATICDIMTVKIPRPRDCECQMHPLFNDEVRRLRGILYSDGILQ